MKRTQIKHFNTTFPQSNPIARHNLSTLPCPSPEKMEFKTGLGSSAAMVTSLVQGVMCTVFGCTDLHLVHRIAQLCHCACQNKVGSGFDVASACFGSSIYVRFPKQDLEQALQGQGALPNKLDFEVTPINLHSKGLFLVCGDVEGGSETPSMSRKVLAWLEASDKGLWNRLVASNQELIESLKEIRLSNQEVEYLSRTPSSQWTHPGMASMASRFKANRVYLKEISDLAKVPIEPPSQSLLCDATLEVDGVLTCACPGAGGFDAVYALCVGEESRDKVVSFWEQYKGGGKVCPLLLEEGTGGVL